jgi:hypothetical protein
MDVGMMTLGETLDIQALQERALSGLVPVHIFLWHLELDFLEYISQFSANEAE